MFAAGLVDEVRRLIDHGLRDGKTASRALGYQQVLAALDGRTVEQALASGETCKSVWHAVWESLELPARDR
jgi:tRNA dimethylallyltransferase